MQLAATKFRSTTPPLWYVSNGETTVGPVRTDLLVRGVWFDRIPPDCQVREARWMAFRAMDQVREVAAARRARSLGFAGPRVRLGAPRSEDLARCFACATDPREVITFLLNEVIERTGAEFGVIHRAVARYGFPVTACVRGPGLVEQLGQAVSVDDPSITLARTGRLVFGAPEDGFIERRIALRLGQPRALRGVALLPVITSGQLVAVLELGRRDHAFRRRDVQIAQALKDAAISRLSSHF